MGGANGFVSGDPEGPIIHRIDIHVADYAISSNRVK